MIRIFVGCDPNHCDAESQSVLEWSLRRHASEEVDITWMKLSRDPASFCHSDGDKGWQTQRWATTFSGFRWAIPAACGFQGRAIYSDSDVIFTADVAELWGQEFAKGKAVMAKGAGSWRLCVSLWDCAEVKRHVLPLATLRGNADAHRIMTARISGGNFVQGFEGNWNCLDGENYAELSDPRIKAIHYTSIGTQPQLRHAIPRLQREGKAHWFNGEVKEHWRPDLIALFDRLLEEAKANGFGPERYCAEPCFGAVEKRDLAHYHSGPRAA